MTPQGFRDAARPPAEREHRRGKLALALQEIFTAIVRLRANRQRVTDLVSFRNHVKQLLATAHSEAARAGYDAGDVKLAIYAAVVFLDESVLNSRLPAFAEWPRRPLQEELFGGHMGGETFFKNLHALIGRQDSDDLGDVLEAYQLCLLLGFRGRYGTSGRDELRAWAAATAEKLGRIRGAPGRLSPSWAPPRDEVVEVPDDRWLRPLAITAAATFAVMWLLSFLFWFGQQGWITELKALVP